jgi:FemAB-related protein (PEP-CTERM system-associated)
MNIEILKIQELESKDECDWNAYVEAMPAATFFHRIEWKRLLEETYGFAGRYLLAKRAGAICGILPLAHVRRFPFPPALISSPLCVYGGAVADADDIARDLEDAAAGLAESLEVAYLELRNLNRLREGWPVSNRMATFRKQISDSHDANMQAIPRKARAEVRKGIKRGFTVTADRDLSQFMPAYARSVRDLGSPVFAKRYFQALLDAFGKDCRIKTLLLDGSVRISLMSFYFKNEVLPYYTGAMPDARREAAYAFLYWNLMREAVEEGCRVFDFGRSTVGTGAYDFKRFWGFEPTLLNYQHHLVTASKAPDVNPANPKYRFAIKTWQKLPLPVANLLGPLVSKAVV